MTLLQGTGPPNGSAPRDLTPELLLLWRTLPLKCSTLGGFYPDLDGNSIENKHCYCLIFLVIALVRQKMRFSFLDPTLFLGRYIYSPENKCTLDPYEPIVPFIYLA